MTTEWIDIGVNNWGIYQHKNGLRYTIDSFILAHFAQPKPKQVVYDLGTGMGIVAMLMCGKEPTATYTGLELQPQLVDLATKSALRNGIHSEHLRFIVCDLRKPPKELANQADLVVANPPFFKCGHGAINEDDERSLARHEHCLNLQELCKSSAYFLRNRGRFVLLHRTTRIDEAIATAYNCGLKPSQLTPICATADKKSKLSVLECVFKGNQEFVINPPFVLYDANGNYNANLTALYQGVH